MPVKFGSMEKAANDERAGKLEEAQRLVEEVFRTLDGSRFRCTCCGVDVLKNKDHGRKLEVLAGVHEKLGRIAGSFRTEGRK